MNPRPTGPNPGPNPGPNATIASGAPRRAVAIARTLGMAALLVFFGWRADWAAIGGALARPGAAAWLAAALAAYAVGQIANGLAWRRLLADAGAFVSFVEMVRHDLSSVFWSTVLPGGVAGEIVKGVRLARDADPGTVAVGIVAARLIGGTVACVLALGLLPWASLTGPPRAVGAVALAVVAGFGSCGLVALRLGPAALAGLPRVGPLPALLARIPTGRFPSPPAVVAATLLTLVTHLAFAGVYTLCFAAAGAPVSLADGAVICALTSVAQLAPVTVGGFGVRELTIAGLGATFVPAARADAAAIALTATFTVVVALGGLVELSRLRGRR